MYIVSVCERQSNERNMQIFLAPKSTIEMLFVA